MDVLAGRACLGKGNRLPPVRHACRKVLGGPPLLGPGADPLDRLIAYDQARPGQARIALLLGHRDIARATLDGGRKCDTEGGISRLRAVRSLRISPADKLMTTG